MGAIQFVSPGAPFLAAAGLCVPAAVALALIRPGDIDYRRARGGEGRKEPHAARWRDLVRNHRLVVFALCLLLFQFANASLVPLASERLAANYKLESELITAALVVVPQLVTAAISRLVARRAETWGRKPLLLVGFAVVPVQAALFALVPGPWFLVGVQVLAGISAVVVGIMTPLVVADVVRGTARYNLSLGAVGTVSGLGAAVSTTASGFVAQALGFDAGFISLAVVALLGLALVWFALAETAHEALQGDVV